MGISPITLPAELNPAVQDGAVQNNPAVRAVPAQATTALQPTQASATEVQIAQGANQIPDQGEIQQLFFSGESVSQIANTTGLSTSEVDIELGISTNLTSLAPVDSASGSTTAPSATTTAAIAAYAAVPGPTASAGTSPSAAATDSGTLSVEF